MSRRSARFRPSFAKAARPTRTGHAEKWRHTPALRCRARQQARHLRNSARHEHEKVHLRDGRRHSERQETESRDSRAALPAPCSTADEIDLPMDYDSVAKAGSMLGSGGMVVMDEDTCMVDMARRIMHFYAHESCGWCIPCREGTTWLRKMLEVSTPAVAARKTSTWSANSAKNMLGRTFCPLGDAAAMPTISIVEKFRSEFEDHLNGRCAYKSSRSAGRSAIGIMAEQKLVNLKINDRDLQVPAGTLVIDAAKQIATEFPRSATTQGSRCRLPAACAWSRSKRCRSCRPPARWRRPMAWWSAPILRRSSKRAKASLEFLLTNHPLDCPVCDKGGECELQDMVFRYGADSSRFVEEKIHRPRKNGRRLSITTLRAAFCAFRCVRVCDEGMDVKALAWACAARTASSFPIAKTILSAKSAACALTFVRSARLPAGLSLQDAALGNAICPDDLRALFERLQNHYERTQSRNHSREQSRYERHQRRFSLCERPLRLRFYETPRTHQAADGAQRRQAFPGLVGRSRADRCWEAEGDPRQATAATRSGLSDPTALPTKRISCFRNWRARLSAPPTSIITALRTTRAW